MSTLKPDLTRVWAEGAPPANVVDPDLTTPGKVAQGWQAEVPPFEHFNYLQQWFSQGLAHINEHGICVWDTETIYPIDGIAKGSDGQLYSAVIEQNNNDPVGDNGTNWVTFSNPSSTVDSMEALRDLPVGGKTLFNLTGYYGRGTPGAGSFYWDETNTDPDDGGMTILPTGHVGAGRRVRINSGYVDVSFFGAKVGPTNDAYPGAQAAIAWAESVGGTSVHFGIDGHDNIYISDTLTVSDDGVRIILHCNVILTHADGTNPKSAIEFLGVSTASALTGCALIGNGFAIDGNGLVQDSNGYIYTTGQGYGSVLFKYCEKPLAEDVICKNGLVMGIKFLSCREPVARGVSGVAAVHDNGISITQDPDNYIATDETTWANGLLDNCTAYGNRDFGITIFNASNCVMINPQAIGNGRTVSGVPNGGGMSVETITNKDTKAKIIGGLAANNEVNGIFCSGSAQILGTDIDGVTGTGSQVWHLHGLAIYGAKVSYSTGKINDCAGCCVYGKDYSLGSSNMVDVILKSVQLTSPGVGFSAVNVANFDIVDILDVSASGVNHNNDFSFVNAFGNPGEGSLKINKLENSGFTNRSIKIDGCKKLSISGVRGVGASLTGTNKFVQISDVFESICDDIYLETESTTLPVNIVEIINPPGGDSAEIRGVGGNCSGNPILNNSTLRTVKFAKNDSKETALQDGDTTPSVLGVQFCRTTNSAETLITDFDDGHDGQFIFLRCNNNNTVLVDGPTLITTTGANIGVSPPAVVLLCRVLGIWYVVNSASV